MRRGIVGVLLFFGILGVGTPALNGAGVSPTRQWAIVNFVRTTQVAGYTLEAGQYLIVHDVDKMDRGEPCTSIYSFGESGIGPQEEVVAFFCIARKRPPAGQTKLLMEQDGPWNMDKLIEYQFAGDAEGHGVPEHPSAGVVGPHTHEGY